MASRIMGRVGRLRYPAQFWVSTASAASQFLCQVRVSGKVDRDGSGSNACNQKPRNWSSSELASSPRRARNGRAYPPASSRGDTVGWPITASVAIFSRSFAAKTKKIKSRSEETVEVDVDVAAVAKDSATKMMEMAVDILSREHSKLRTGRASSGMLDHITVEAHGVRTPLSHIAAVSVAGLQTLSVLPYDPSMVKEVEKSLVMSPLGLNPVVEGSILTVPLPRLTKEVCESMCKLAVKAGETAKLSIRRARKDALDRVKAAGMSKDDMKRVEKEVEELTKKYVKISDELCKKKEKEILT